MKSFRDIRIALRAGLLLYRGSFGEPGGGTIVGLLREMNSISEYLFESGGYSGFKSE
jgi:hypothetical protein